MDSPSIDFVRLLAILDQISIENNPNLSREEKEFWKSFVDHCKQQVESANRIKPLY